PRFWAAQSMPASNRPHQYDVPGQEPALIRSRGEAHLECGAEVAEADLSVVGRVGLLGAGCREAWAQVAHANLTIVGCFALLGARRREVRAQVSHAYLAAVLHLRRRESNLHCYLQLIPDRLYGVGESAYASDF